MFDVMPYLMSAPPSNFCSRSNPAAGKFLATAYGATSRRRGGRIHGKLKAGSTVVVGIDHDFDLITADADVAAGQKFLDAVGMRVEGSYENVEIVVVVGDLGLRGDARVRILGRLELPEVLDDRGEAPSFVVVFPVDHRRDSPAGRPGGRRGRRRRGRRGRNCV